MKPLEKLVAALSELHNCELIPAKNIIYAIRQLLLFPEDAKMFHHVSLGNYYESMTAALWGGELTNRVHILRNGSSEEVVQNDSREGVSSDRMFGEEEIPFDFDSEEDTLIKPDLVDKDGKAIGESKACRSGHSCNLFDAQIYRYKELQFENQDSEVYFVFYRHNLMKVKSFQGTESDLFRDMADRTFFAVRLPLSVILAIHQLGKEGEKPHLLRRYDGQTFPWCTILRSPTINKLFADTKKVFEEFELNIGDYVFERYLSPRNFEIEGHPIKQFPILCVHDRNLKKWVNRFVSENKHLKKESYDPRIDGCSDC